MIHGQLITGAI